MAGIVFKLASFDHAIEYAVGFCTLKWTGFVAGDVTGDLASFSCF